jgi:hypothetical protein
MTSKLNLAQLHDNVGEDTNHAKSGRNSPMGPAWQVGEVYTLSIFSIIPSQFLSCLRPLAAEFRSLSLTVDEKSSITFR